jgi:hypothetical protein
MQVSRLILAVLVVAACGGTETTSADAGEATGSGGAGVDPGGGGSSTGGARPPVPSRICGLNSDCASGLVCGFGLCHAACRETADCPAPQRCVRTSAINQAPSADSGTSTVSVCLLPSEARCLYNSDCAVPLVCAVDSQCRSQCKADSDCPLKQLCVHGVCAEQLDVTSSGDLVGGRRRQRTRELGARRKRRLIEPHSNQPFRPLDWWLVFHLGAHRQGCDVAVPALLDQPGTLRSLLMRSPFRFSEGASAHRCVR